MNNPLAFVVNKEVWASWTPADRDAVRAAAIEAGKIEFERWKIERQEATKIEIAELGAQTTLSGQQATAAQLAAEGKTPEFAKSVNENFTKLHGRIDEVARLATAKRVLIRDKAGRPVASQIEGM